MIKTSLPSDQASSTAAALTQALFGERLDQLHEPWRKLFSTEPFSFREGLSPDERAALSYERLHLINEELDSPEDFVVDVERLAALHEWVGPVDAGLGTVASIHYNLFLGSLLEHTSGPNRDLREFVELRRTGTFLCTEAGHGNSASQLETTATYDRTTGEFVLNTPSAAARKFMPNTSSTGGPKTAVVAARLITDGKDQGVFLFLTPLSDETGQPMPGVEIRRLPQTATAPVDHCVTSFDQVRLPQEALLQSDHGRLTPEGVFTSSIGSPRKRFLHSIGRVTAGEALHERLQPRGHAPRARRGRTARPREADFRRDSRRQCSAVRSPQPPRSTPRCHRHHLRRDSPAPRRGTAVGAGNGVGAGER